DGGGQLHAVVGGGRFAAPDLTLVLAADQHRAPATRPRIPAAGAVRIDHHLGRGAAHGAPSKRWMPARCTASLRSYSSGSLGRTSAPAGVAPQSASRVRKNRSAAPH